MYKYHEPMYERIRRIRLLRSKYLKDENCSEDKFARYLGIKPGLLRKIELGEEEPSTEMLSKASKILKVSIEHLLENKIIAEDELTEPITFTPQIGSVIHATRTGLIKASESNWRQYSLKSVSQKLGVSSMELKRIEDLNGSKNLDDPKFMKKLASLFNLPLTYIMDLRESSFPRGETKKKDISIYSKPVHYLRDGNAVRGIIVLNEKLNKCDFDILEKRIKFEIELLSSNPAKK